MANVPNQGVSAIALAIASAVAAPSKSGNGDSRDMRLLANPLPRARTAAADGAIRDERHGKQEIITPKYGWDEPTQSFKERFIKRNLMVRFEKRHGFDAKTGCAFTGADGKVAYCPGIIVTAYAHVFTSRGLSIDHAVVLSEDTGKAAGKAAGKGAIANANASVPAAPQLRKTRQAGTKHVASSTSMLSPAAAAVADVPLKSSEDIAADIAAQKAARLGETA